MVPWSKILLTEFLTNFPEDSLSAYSLLSLRFLGTYLHTVPEHPFAHARAYPGGDTFSVARERLQKQACYVTVIIHLVSTYTHV